MMYANMSNPVKSWRGTIPEVFRFTTISELILFSLQLHIGTFHVINGDKTTIAFVEDKPQIKFLQFELPNGHKVQDEMEIPERIYPLRTQTDFECFFEYLLDTFVIEDKNKTQQLYLEMNDLIRDIRKLPKSNFKIKNYDEAVMNNESYILADNGKRYTNGTAQW